ncbi:MAG TPA: phage portal protein [Thermoguttaceae bacterium]|nr:phage portal protein [Thermoguttaceae bacterium]
MQTTNATTNKNLNPRTTHLERRLLEAFDRLWDEFVDPTDAFYDTDGQRWTQIGSTTSATNANPAFVDEHQLAEIRNQCRTLAATNEFAINGQENRISYIVGSGHAYRVVARHGVDVADVLLLDAQAVVDQFVRLNSWHRRQQEIVRRKDRDGECFVRLFFGPDGTTRLRFVEPDQVATPSARVGDSTAACGIQTETDDVETVVGFWVDGGLVDAEEIQFRKANVDANVRRGLPLFYPVRKNLRRAEKLLRNMSVVAEIQSAIALIRKHGSATGAGLEQFVADGADVSVTNSATARTDHFRRYGPGTILDATAGTEYDFPAAGIDATRFVAVLQAELRAIAARLVMPEFMLTSDASNANYSSTMVAEGPAVKMFDRLQHDMIEDDVQLIWRVIGHAVRSGRLPAEALDTLEIRATAPGLSVRDRLKDAQADQILVRNGAMSVQTMAIRHGLDPRQEEQWGGVRG